jgi:hypothetical protein
VILLQINPISSDEPEIIYEGFHKIENTSIFAWSSILGIEHYHWLCGSIRQLLSNSKANYLIRTI